jgi:hypothetical protein
MSKIANILERITKLGLETRGCTDSEIEEIQTAAGFPLPAAYVEFLRIAGRSIEDYPYDTIMFYPKLIKLNNQVQHEYKQRFIDMPPRFVFFSWDGNERLLFCENSGDDPRILGWKSEITVVHQYDSFTTFLDMLIKDYEIQREATRRCPNRN